MASNPGHDSEQPNSSLTDDFLNSATPEVLGSLTPPRLVSQSPGRPELWRGGAFGPLVPHLIKTLEERQRRAGQSADRMLTWTSELTGKSPAELHAWAVHNDERLNLLAATVQAALASLDQVKVRTLAHVLAEAVEDDAKLDVAALMTQTLAELEPPHIRVLKVMYAEQSPRSASGEPLAEGAWLLSTLAQRFPHLAGGLLPIMATLNRHALVHENAFGAARADGRPDPVWNATQYGPQLLAYLALSSSELGASD